MNEFFKKLNADKTAPEGDVYIRSNIEMILEDINIDDPAALLEKGYCYHQNEPQPIYKEAGNYTKEWRNNGDVRIGDEANNKWGFDWQEVDITSELSSDELDELKSRAWHDLRDMRNVYLKRTDWWELPSQSPMSAERTAYRKALRDLPANTTDPFDVTWPTPPEDIDNP